MVNEITIAATAYECEVCGRSYRSEEEAEKCETKGEHAVSLEGRGMWGWCVGDVVFYLYHPEDAPCFSSIEVGKIVDVDFDGKHLIFPIVLRDNGTLLNFKELYRGEENHDFRPFRTLTVVDYERPIKLKDTIASIEKIKVMINEHEHMPAHMAYYDKFKRGKK